MRIRFALPLLAWLVLPAGRAAAAPSFVDRDLVLRHGDVALDFGLGMAHVPPPVSGPSNGFGLNLELAFGLARGVELGLRTGFRLDNLGQATRADSYGRLFETETYDEGGGRTANPELYALWSVARGGHAELGVKLAAFLPLDGSPFGMMVAMPIALHGGSLRLDTGIYVPVLFTHPHVTTLISIPAHLWIQVTSRFWLGPLFGMRVVTSNGGGNVTYPLGFGLGSMLNSGVDLRGWILFPDIDRDRATRTFGVGVSLQFRFE